jgi:hypothetical protein
MRPRLAMPLRAMAALLVVLLQAPVVAQECWYDVWGYDDWYDNGIDMVHVYGHVFDDSDCPSCFHSNRKLILSVYGPNGSVSDTFYGGSSISGGLALVVTISGQVTYWGDFEIWCSCVSPWYGPLYENLFERAQPVSRQPPPCRPPVVAPLMRHIIELSQQPEWGTQWLWVEQEVDDARRRWAFLFQEHWPGTVAPFRWHVGVLPPTLTIHVDYVPLVGGWGGVSPGRDQLWISPDSLGWGAVWVLQVIMHEFGHARGWGHVFTPDCSIMFTPQDPWNFTFGFLDGDHVAVDQDGPP